MQSAGGSDSILQAAEKGRCTTNGEDGLTRRAKG
jgi:hypothetical protein